MKKTAKILFATTVFATSFMQAQFRTRDRMDRLEGFDEKKYSWGFYLAGNFADYKLILDPKYGMDGHKNAVESKGTGSFGAGLIGKMRLNENFDLRLEPGLQFVQRELTFNTQNNSQYVTDPAQTMDMALDANKNRTIKSTYIDVPLLLEFHGDRWYNSRPYAAAGVNYLVNLQSNSGSTDDNQQGVFRSTSHNFGWSAEAGIQFYFSRFKLTPAFRGTFMTNNELIADNPSTPPYWAKAITSAQTRSFFFVLKFE